MDLLNKLTIAWKITFEDLYDRAIKIKKTTVSKTGSKITIQTKQAIEDFSFRINGQIESNPDFKVDNETNIVIIRDLRPSASLILL